MADSGAMNEQTIISESANIPLKKDDTWYLIDRKWWEEFCEYVGLEPNEPSKKSEKSGGQRPGNIDNSDLLQKVKDLDFYEMKEKLIEHTHFEVVHSTAWEQLEKWYGGGPAIARKVITLGISQMTTIEYYPLLVRLFIADSNTGEPSDNGQDLVISKHDTFETVLTTYYPTNKEYEENDKKKRN